MNASHEVIGASRIEPFMIELGSSVQKLSSMSLLKSVVMFNGFRK